MNIAVIDDLQTDRMRLGSFIEQYCEENRVINSVHMFQDAEEFLHGFHPKQYDVIFMDIYLKNMDGIAAAQCIREQDETALLVFSTISERHAVQSYRVHAFDYLLKPYNYEQFFEVFQQCNKTISLKSRFIEVKEGRERIKILLDDIIYTDYYNHYIQIHTSWRVIRTYMKFAEFSPMLLDFSEFLCCYRNCIINLDKVTSFDNGGFCMKNGEIIPVMRSKVHEMKQHYADYMFAKIERGV